MSMRSAPASKPSVMPSPVDSQELDVILPRLAHPARAEDDRLGLEGDQLARGPPVADGAADPVAVLEQALDVALHVHVDALVHGVLLERADHLEAGAVAHVGEARVAVPAEVALER